MRRAEGWLMLLVMGSGLFVVSPLLPAIAEELGVSEGRAGWTVTAYAVGYLMGGPALGSLADRYGPRPVLAVALAGFAVANAATAVVPGFGAMLLCRAVAGVAASGVTPSVYALVGASAPDGRRASWLGVVTSGLLVALAAGAPAGALAASAVGWRGVFAGVGGIAAAVLAVSLRSSMPAAVSLRGSERAVGAHGSAPVVRAVGARRAAAVVGVRAGLRAVSLTGLWGFAVYGLHTYLAVGLAGSPYASPTLVAVTLAGYGVGAVAGNLVGGVLADRLGARRVTVASLGTAAVLAAVLGVVVHSGPVAPVLAAGLFAMAAYPFFNAHQVRLLVGFPGAAGTVLAWNNTALYGGILLGSAVGAQLLPLVGFGVLGLVVAAVALAGAVAAGRAVPAPAAMPVTR